MQPMDRLEPDDVVIVFRTPQHADYKRHDHHVFGDLA